MGPEKVLDLAQCRRWSAGELGCLAAMLRPVLSPIMRVVVRMRWVTTMERIMKTWFSPAKANSRISLTIAEEV